MREKRKIPNEDEKEKIRPCKSRMSAGRQDLPICRMGHGPSGEYIAGGVEKSRFALIAFRRFTRGSIGVSFGGIIGRRGIRFDLQAGVG